jgi:L-iditol 2-dehydrogenase
MQCIVVEEVGSFRATDRPVPEPRQGEALIKVEIAGLCRTDLKLIEVGHRDLVLPRIPAEEVVGTVTRLGPETSGFHEGQRVWVYPGLWCDDCPSCRKGAENLCRQMQIMGFHRDGGFAEYVTAPTKSLIPVPKGLSPAQAVFAEPLSCCLNAIELCRVSSGESVGIWGAGPAGTLLARAAAHLGAEVCVIEPDPARRERVGGVSEAGNRSFDVAIVAVGAKEAYDEAIGHLAPCGRLSLFSGLSPTEERIPVSFNELHYQEQSLVGAYGCCLRHGVEALKLIHTGVVEVADLISHTLPLSELGSALERVAQRRCMKIHLLPGRQ